MIFATGTWTSAAVIAAAAVVVATADSFVAASVDVASAAETFVAAFAVAASDASSIVTTKAFGEEYHAHLMVSPDQPYLSNSYSTHYPNHAGALWKHSIFFDSSEVDSRSMQPVVFAAVVDPVWMTVMASVVSDDDLASVLDPVAVAAAVSFVNTLLFVLVAVAFVMFDYWPVL